MDPRTLNQPTNMTPTNRELRAKHYTNFGQVLSEYRSKAGLSQAELEKRLQEACIELIPPGTFPSGDIIPVKIISIFETGARKGGVARTRAAYEIMVRELDSILGAQGELIKAYGMPEKSSPKTLHPLLVEDPVINAVLEIAIALPKETRRRKGGIFALHSIARFLLDTGIAFDAENELHLSLVTAAFDVITEEPS